ncbi:hypothetical protein JYK14_01235 [Siccirubricoccus sp. KC 17139]|uniref:Uncharacterized protein n=1 Tax=Siccirubricoccus soli TaxID=2899147 RepID=A0ABT1CYR2_9PROT|nr:hypothetical protein [Siccirubricoccus soli]MCO6414804.1 hypothetical protein [Siccirubricoccus soli]MCP2680934.1 hypothetical protein [Siccirubricoccus soli]
MSTTTLDLFRSQLTALDAGEIVPNVIVIDDEDGIHERRLVMRISEPGIYAATGMSVTTFHRLGKRAAAALMLRDVTVSARQNLLQEIAKLEADPC